jgi:hypothetical protein
MDGVRRAVAVGKEDGGVVGDVREPDEGDGAEDPAHLRHAPWHGEYTGADNGGNGVHRRRPYRSCKCSGQFGILLFTVRHQAQDHVVEYHVRVVLLLLASQLRTFQPKVRNRHHFSTSKQIQQSEPI